MYELADIFVPQLSWAYFWGQNGGWSEATGGQLHLFCGQNQILQSENLEIHLKIMYSFLLSLRLVWGHLKLPEKMFENLSVCWLGSYFVWLVLYATSWISIILEPRSRQMLRSLEVVSDHLWPISNFCSLRIVEGDHWRLSFFWGSKLPQHQNLFMKTFVYLL